MALRQAVKAYEHSSRTLALLLVPYMPLGARRPSFFFARDWQACSFHCLQTAGPLLVARLLRSIAARFCCLKLQADLWQLQCKAAMRALILLALHAVAAFDYKSISVNAPRRVVTQDDIDAKFEEVDKPYALYPVDGPAEEGLCVLAEISLTSPGFSWKRDNYIVELLDDQAEPFAAISLEICDAGMKAGGRHEFSFPVNIDMRAALLPEFGDLEQGTTCSCRVAVRRVVDKQLVRTRRLLQYAVAASALPPTPSPQRRTIGRPRKRRRSSATACARVRSWTPRLSPPHCSRPRPKKSSGRTGEQSSHATSLLTRTPCPRSC